MKRVPKQQLYKQVPRSLGACFHIKDSEYYFIQDISSSKVADVIHDHKLKRIASSYYANEITSLIVLPRLVKLISVRPLLNEETRLQIINKAKSNSSYNRYDRRLTIKSYESTFKLFDVNEFRKSGNLVLDIMVGKYSCIIQVNDFKQRLKARGKVTHLIVRSELSRALDKSDILVDCSCPDFKYRYSHTASVNGYKYGRKEIIPSNKTNPFKEGSVCKHLASLLSNKSWVSKYASSINSYFRENPELLGGFYGTI